MNDKIHRLRVVKREQKRAEEGKIFKISDPKKVPSLLLYISPPF